VQGRGWGSDENGKPIVHEEPVLVRVHSECLTGDVFGIGAVRLRAATSAADADDRAGRERRADLSAAGRARDRAGEQAARVALQEKGLDTVEANVRLGLPVDKRDYGIGSQILRDLGLRKLRILTNNPKKIYGIMDSGCAWWISALKIEPGEYNKAYLATRKRRWGHTL